ncbi:MULTISPECIES: exonuclease SbcCD subunit D C-terminal domain-containing protein [Rufibacter]|uniref:Nuclease SbcCD subunit D n=1 Tax=Rufibacter quisquiliarum TaxID=1549639 RepID=A0A839GP79_9BACT|nr:MULTISPECIES: exonuclease SbcCD subunit D C-terminal domain-containing protein [Rufibacter]MBA9076248.1 exonuclease SbcD [Rufibacter quisquiliarum]
MRVLHTADWHLGQRLANQERTEEHRLFLNWLCQTICDEKIDLLLMAGDVFDTGFPSNTALKLYYDFLREVKDTCCQEVVIIGGNHDSVSTLNAPADLLRHYKVHVVGGAPADCKDQVIAIAGADGQPQLVVCAVPFLRDKDVRLSVPGETAEEREARLKQGICDHYAQLVPLIQEYKQQGIPVLATGHLFAAGSSASDSEKEIHVGNLGQIAGDQFPAEFDYVALGHLHRPQVVNKLPHIRYSGSPIPLSFSEVTDKKQVVILDIEDGKLARLHEKPVPCWRKLVRFKGTIEEVFPKILAFDNSGMAYPAWAEVQLQYEHNLHEQTAKLQEAFSLQPNVQLLIHRPQRTISTQSLDQQIAPEQDLADLKPKEVFLKKCEEALDLETYQDLLSTFDELLELMPQKEEEEPVRHALA